jgi:O-antigen ligase
VFFWPSFYSPFFGAKTTLLLIVGAIAVFASLSKNGGTIFPEKILQWAAIFCIAAFILSTFFAHNWTECWHVLALFAAAAIFFAALIRQKISVQSLLWAVAISAIAVAIVAIIGHYGYDLPRFFMGTAAAGRMRTASTLGNPLFTASFLACAVWAVIAIPIRVIWRALLAVIVLAGMASTSERTAVFAFVAGAIVISFLGRNALGRGTRTRTTVLIAIFLLVSTAKYSANPRSFSTTMEGRVFLWETSLHHVKFLGSGPGSFYRVYNANLREPGSTIPPNKFHFINYETDAHNMFVQTTVEEGVLGLLAMLAFFAAWFRVAWHSRTTLAGQCAIAAVSAFLAAGLSDDPLSRPEGIALLAVLLAVPVLIRDNSAIFTLKSSRLGLRSSSPIFVPIISLLLLLAAGLTAFTNYALHQGEQAGDRGDWAQAERWDRAILKFDPAERNARYNLVRALAQEGKYEASFAESEKALHWVNEAELHIIRIRILPMLGRTQQAQQELIQAQKEFPWSEELQEEAVPGIH